MFDWVHNNKRIMQAILALIFLPFAFFGVDSYFRGSELGAEVARIGDYKVTQQELQQAVRDRQELLRRMLNQPIDQAALDTPEARFEAVEQIVRERLLLSRAVGSGLTVTDEQLREVITSQETFRENGKFSPALYESFLRSQNQSAVGFEAKLRRDLLQQPLLDAFGESGFVSSSVAERIVRLSEQTREVRIATLAPLAFASQVSIDESEIKSVYDGRPREFEIPEQVRLEYVVLSLDNLAAQTEAPAEEVKQAYEQSRARFASPEERDASHILISVPPEASAEAKAVAKARTEELLKLAREKPDRFAALAREHSQDPGSANNGGELGFLSRDPARKAFDEALFAMKPGEIAGPVETEFGYHVILLKSVRGGSTKAFDEVKSSIEGELKRTRASKRFAELAEQLNNIAYEQSDSLKPAAEALKVQVQQSPWITRRPVPGSPLGGERFLKAAFSEDVVKNKRNSEVVDVAPGTLIATRLLEHKPPTTRPFDEVKSEIRKRLIEEEARKRALADGREKLDKLRKGNQDVGITWSKPFAATRFKAEGLSEPVLREVFRADATKLPAFAGAEDANGFQLIRVDSVIEVSEVSADARKAAAGQLKRLIAQEQLADYVAALKRRVDVRIKTEVIEKKEK